MRKSVQVWGEPKVMLMRLRGSTQLASLSGARQATAWSRHDRPNHTWGQEANLNSDGLELMETVQLQVPGGCAQQTITGAVTYYEDAE